MEHRETLAQPMEETAPYTSDSAQEANRIAQTSLDTVKKIRTVHLIQAKARGEKFAVLTCYDYLTAQVFDSAGIEVLLIGDSAGNNVLGHESTLTVTVDQLLPMVAAVSAGSRRALVLADLPFGSYQLSPSQAVETASRFVKEGGAHAVKMEVSAPYAEHVRAVVQAGIPVMAHIGFTPQSEHALGGFRVQGRDKSAQRLVDNAQIMEEAGAFALLLEMTVSKTATAIDQSVSIPTVGIGAGAGTTAQVLVWQDAFGLRQGKMARFVKQYANLHSVLREGAQAFRNDIISGTYPGPEHRFDS